MTDEVRLFKTRWVDRWAAAEGLHDIALVAAAEEIKRGLVGVNLGGHGFKKRVALPGRGKRAGARTLIAFRKGHHVFFVFGFSKNHRSNISGRELKALRRLAKALLSYDEAPLEKAIEANELIEVRVDGA